MADRPDLPRIKPKEAPSLLNVEAGIGSFVGDIVGSITSRLLLRGNRSAANAAAIGGLVGGGLLGGMRGKAQQEREMIEGRVVKDPAVLNHGIWGGMTIGALIAAPILFLLRGGRGTGAVALTGLIGGALGGMAVRQKTLQRDFSEAISLRQQEIGALKEKIHTMEQTVKPEPTTFKNTVSDAETAMLNAKEKTGGHTDRATAEPELAEPAR